MMRFSPVIDARDGPDSEMLALAGDIVNGANRCALDSIMLDGTLRRPALGSSSRAAAALLAELEATTNACRRLAQRLATLREIADGSAA